MGAILPIDGTIEYMEERFMPARVIQNSGGGKNLPKKQSGPKKVQISAPEFKESKIEYEMKLAAEKNFSNIERAQFYGGHDRLDLQGNHVQRVRELQEENDHLQREIAAKEGEISESTDPLATLADIEHRKIIIARNTGEILKIYLKNEERMKRVKELESHNNQIQSQMMEMQGRFISTKDMEEKTKFASEFFILKSEIERNLLEISDLSKI
ncbi:MAG: hypothetical protein KR126chlam1_01272 [Chlamydiae bacterium]|nr:hypothetical protein [Chlamydiota bacterium]